MTTTSEDWTFEMIAGEVMQDVRSVKMVATYVSGMLARPCWPHELIAYLSGNTSRQAQLLAEWMGA